MNERWLLYNAVFSHSPDASKADCLMVFHNFISRSESWPGWGRTWPTTSRSDQPLGVLYWLGRIIKGPNHQICAPQFVCYVDHNQNLASAGPIERDVFLGVQRTGKSSGILKQDLHDGDLQYVPRSRHESLWAGSSYTSPDALPPPLMIILLHNIVPWISSITPHWWDVDICDKKWINCNNKTTC